MSDYLYCTRCGAELDPDKAKWLELGIFTGAYTDPDVTPIPEDASQGCFPFGKACAQFAIKEGEIIRGRK